MSNKLEVVSGNGKKYATGIPYSTSERQIGTWIDNRPLYRKTYKGNCSTASIIYLQQNVSLGIKDLIFSLGTITVSAYSQTLPINWTGSNGYDSHCDKDAGDVRLLIGTAYRNANNTYEITIFYTKTTD